jgi:hypothetical protein
MGRSRSHSFATHQRSTINKQVAPVTSAPSFATQQPQQSSLGQSMKDGFGMGIGSAIAHRAVSAVFGAPKVEMIGLEKKDAASATTILQPTPYEQCMKYNTNDHETCKSYLTGSQNSSQ